MSLVVDKSAVSKEDIGDGSKLESLKEKVETNAVEKGRKSEVEEEEIDCSFNC